MNELRFAVRRLRQSPGFTFTALVVLAIAIGLNTAIFSVVDALVLHPLNLPQADRIVHVGENMKGFGEVGTSYPNFLDWRREAKSLASSSAINSIDLTLLDHGTAERVPAMKVSYGFFDVVGVRPALGRGFRPDEDQQGAGGRVVISDALWHRRFGHDGSLIRRSITLDGQAFTVVGILPPSFTLPLIQFDAIIPFGPAGGNARGSHAGLAIARLAPGVTVRQAEAELRAIGKRLSEKYPDKNAGWGLEVTPLREFVSRDYGAVMLTLLAAVVLVLLIACVNLAGLMLVRAAGRRRELAVRTALGARPFAILRETVLESVLLSVAGSALGILLGSWSVAGLLSFLPAGTPAPVVSLNFRVVLFAAAITFIASMLFGLIPALRTLNSDPNEALKEGGRANTGSLQGNRLRGALVIAEISLALVLALGAGLVMKSFEGLRHVNPGFDPQRALTMEVSLVGPAYEPVGPAHEESASIDFWDRFLKTAAQQAAIRAVGIVSFLPMTDHDTQQGYYIEGRPAPKSVSNYSFADAFIIGGDYLKAVGIGLVSGRSFAETDNAKSPLVAMVDEDFVKKNFPSDDPLKHRVMQEGQAFQIVGVVHHVEAYGLKGDERREQLYLPYRQSPKRFITIVVNPAGDKTSAITAVTRAANAIDSTIPVYTIRSMSDYVSESTWRDRLSTMLLGLFASVALILAAIGIYGVMAYSVAQRTQEIGIRLALGATPQGILRLVMRQACILSALGIGIGAVIALPAASLLQTILYHVSPRDTEVFSFVAILLACIGVIAGAIPAMRASRTDPLTAIRYE